MEIGITTPALLFPAISLLLLAFTNRFLALAALIRNLHERYKTGPHAGILDQIGNLRHRMTLIRNMQLCGVTSLFMCVACMFALFAGQLLLGKVIFGLSLILMMVALAISVREIHLSGNALDLQLRDLEGQISTKRRR
jgi:hypothetical protein